MGELDCAALDGAVGVSVGAGAAEAVGENGALAESAGVDETASDWDCDTVAAGDADALALDAGVDGREGVAPEDGVRVPESPQEPHVVHTAEVLEPVALLYRPEAHAVQAAALARLL